MTHEAQFKIISTNLEFLEGKKYQLENNLETVNFVIHNCKLWIQGDGIKPSFSELLLLFAKVAGEEMITSGVSAKGTNLKKEQGATDQIQAALNVEQTTATKEAHDKLMARLDIFEEALASLRNSNKMNDNNITEMRKSIKKNNKEVNKRMSDHDSKLIQLAGHQQEQFKMFQVEIATVRREIVNSTQLMSRTKDQVEIESVCKEVKNLTGRIKGVENAVVTLKACMKTINSSKNLCTILRKYCEERFQQQDEKIALTNIHFLKKIQLLRDINNSSFQACGSSHHQIRRLEDQLASFLSKIDSWNQTTSLYIKRTTDKKKNDTLRVLNQKSKVEKDELNSQCNNKIIKFHLNTLSFHEIVYNKEIHFNAETGIFKVKDDGVYLVDFDLEFDPKQKVEEVSFGLALRSKKKLVDLFEIDFFPVIDDKARGIRAIYFKAADELCFFSENTYNLVSCTFTCVKLYLTK